jgi:hypothetical protein
MEETIVSEIIVNDVVVIIDPVHDWHLGNARVAGLVGDKFRCEIYPNKYENLRRDQIRK